MPAKHAPIVGMVQSRHTPAPLYLVTRDALYSASAASDGTMEQFASLTALNLSSSAFLTAIAMPDGKSDTLYLLDAPSARLHTLSTDGVALTITTSWLSASRPVLHLQPVSFEGVLFLILAEYDGQPLQLATLNVSLDRAEQGNTTNHSNILKYSIADLDLPFTSADMLYASRGLYDELAVATSNGWYSIFLDQPEPAKVNSMNMGDFVDPSFGSAMGGVQFFM